MAFRFLDCSSPFSFSALLLAASAIRLGGGLATQNIRYRRIVNVQRLGQFFGKEPR